MKPLVDAMRNQGKSVAISPEGTRSITPKLAAFKKGPFHLAMQAGVPIVPIVIHNAGDVAPKGEFVFRPATVEVDVLAPIDTSSWRSESIEAHVAEVRNLFLETLGQSEETSPAPLPQAKPEGILPKKGVKKTLKKKPLKASAQGSDSASPAPGIPVLKKKALKKKALKKEASKGKAPDKKVMQKKVPKKKALKKKALKKKALKKSVASPAE
jgi:putative phosphoserine phosphatase/1-acylglycerol-3-phosphate O-acyltransferase